MKQRYSIFRATTLLAILAALYSQQRVAPVVMGFALVDSVLGILFVIAYLRMPKI